MLEDELLDSSAPGVLLLLLGKECADDELGVRSRCCCVVAALMAIGWVFIRGDPETPRGDKQTGLLRDGVLGSLFDLSSRLASLSRFFPLDEPNFQPLNNVKITAKDLKIPAIALSF